MINPYSVESKQKNFPMSAGRELRSLCAAKSIRALDETAVADQPEPWYIIDFT